MAPEMICRELHEAGLQVRTDGERLLVSPMDLLTDETRQLLRDHKPAMLEFLHCRTLEELLVAGDRLCDYYGDSEQARADMRVDCLETPLHLRADLLDHFEQTSGAFA